MTSGGLPSVPEQRERVETLAIFCKLPAECKDPHVNRWHCMRGHALDPVDPAAPSMCPLTVCINRGANR